MRINSFDFTGNYKITNLVYDSGTPQELNLLKLARKDGAKLISSNYTPKEIMISGIITGTSIADLETNLDTFKKNTLITEGTLDTGYAGGYRRYTVDCSACTITRDNYNVTYALFELKYIASDPPFAEEIDSIGGSPLMNEIYSFNAMTQAAYTADVNIDGTAKPKPIFQFILDTPKTLGNISVKNVTSNTQIDIMTAWGSGDVLDINTASEIVQLNLQDIEYEGIFPEFNLGNNDIEINYTVANMLDALNETYTSNWTLFDLSSLGQSFKVNSSVTFNKLDLLIKKNSSATGNITVRIETDNAGAPSGTLVNVNSTATILNSQLTSDLSWIAVNFTAFSMTAGTSYWIVLSCGESFSTPMFWAISSTGNPYSDGLARKSGINYSNADFAFRWYKATANPDWSIDHTLKYQKRFL